MNHDHDDLLFNKFYEQQNEHLVLSEYKYIDATSFIPPQYHYKSITVKSNCFPKVSEVYINGLSKLEKLHIENNSFTARAFGYGNNNSKVFQASNCERLQSIRFGKCNFNLFCWYILV